MSKELLKLLESMRHYCGQFGPFKSERIDGPELRIIDEFRRYVQKLTPINGLAKGPAFARGAALHRGDERIIRADMRTALPDMNFLAGFRQRALACISDLTRLFTRSSRIKTCQTFLGLCE